MVTRGLARPRRIEATPDMNHPLRCRCGALQGYVSHPEKASRGVCYCKDCQAFAHFLGTPGDILDGSYKCTPFFTPDSGTPVVAPKVLTNSELERVMNAVQTATGH